MIFRCSLGRGLSVKRLRFNWFKPFRRKWLKVNAVAILSYPGLSQLHYVQPYQLLISMAKLAIVRQITKLDLCVQKKFINFVTVVIITTVIKYEIL